mgnify:CR=1 FL=1
MKSALHVSLGAHRRINKGGGFPCQGKPPPFPLSYSLFQLLQVIRIRVRKSLVKILDHGIQVGRWIGCFFISSYRWRTDIGILP